MIIRHPPLGFLVVVFALGGSLTSFAQGVPDYPQPGAQREEPAPAAGDAVTPGQIAANPGRYVGSKVQIKNAEIEAVHAKGVFTLDEDLLAAGPDVAVLIPKLAARSTVIKDAKVDVKGTVRTFVATEIKRDYSEISLSAKVEAELEGRPVVIAESVKTIKDGRELVSGAAPETGKEPARSEQPQAPQQQPPPPQPEP